MKLNVREFQEHVNAMTDDEVRESITQAEKATAGFTMKSPLFGIKYTTENGEEHEDVLTAQDFVDAINQISEKTGGAFVPNLSVQPLK